ncbi:MULTISPECIES: ABC transporter substrate-binding protein [unclassified Bacillus (in: firmicutes)]|uniref:ABC transporter substrate-binding protein n=1 Tax=unclassified Bacillus (in: firmicutes) TaxID=185979 RepID=UPI0008E015BD|nr:MULTISPECIES: extracellular solute-binding protein [unclassified Bacillus (in: firmicutes)]SFB19973.1 carbohydrate ABC transporter substrate-binding protein, CUT1 family [Bacillus sp. UNCCL13]SFQ90795.1 carbohydrate ABC transporter substrate-binding protein, CUT1 family [Bacillus sp. cl95]
MLKKVALGLMSVTLSASLLAGCSSNKEEDGKVTLQLFSNKSENIQTYKGLIKEFEAENPNIKIKLDAPPEAETVLKTRLTKNDLPDLMAIGGNATYGELARAGVLNDFSDSELVKTVQPSYVDMIGRLVGSDKKGTFGLPYATNANAVIYNKQKFEQLGLQTPTTWDEFVAALEKAKAAGEIPIYLTLKDAWTGLISWNSLAANIAGEDFAEKKNDGKTTFVKSYDEVADKMLTLTKFGHKDNMGVGYGDGNNAFASGKGVFYLQGNWAIPEIKKANPEIEVGVFPMPVTNDPAKNKLVSGVDIVLTMNKDTEHKKEATKFLEFMMEKETAKKYIDEQKAFSAIQDVFQEDAVFEGIKGNFETGALTSFPDHYYPAGLGAENLLQEFIIKKDKEKFLKKMDSEWEKIQNR